MQNGHPIRRPEKTSVFSKTKSGHFFTVQVFIAPPFSWKFRFAFLTTAALMLHHACFIRFSFADFLRESFFPKHMHAKNPCAFSIFASLFTSSFSCRSSFFFRRDFFSCMLFFPKHMHTKKAREAHLRTIRGAGPMGQPAPKISFKNMRGGVLDEFVFFDRLVLP